MSKIQRQQKIKRHTKNTEMKKVENTVGLWLHQTDKSSVLLMSVNSHYVYAKLVCFIVNFNLCSLEKNTSFFLKIRFYK